MRRIKIFTTVLLFLVLSTTDFGAQIYSNGTGGGDWDQTTTWQGGVVPTSIDDVIIVSGDSVNVPSSTVANIDVAYLTIQSNAKLANSINTSGVSLSVTDEFTIGSNGWYYGNGSTVTTWPSAGSYSIDNASYYVQTGNGSSTIGQPGRATFGNFINAKTGSGSVCGAELTIYGDMIVRTGSTGTTFRGTNSTIGVSQTHHVYGDVYVISGQWVATDAPGTNDGLTGIWNIDGNVTVGDASTPNYSRMGPFASSDGGTYRVGIFNIGGNLNITNGARLQAGSSSSSSSTTETGIINVMGNFTTDATAIYATNSKGYFAINFVGSGIQTIMLGNQLKFSSTSNPVTVNDTVATGSSVMFNSGQTWTCGSSTVGANGYGSWIVAGSLAFSTANDTIIGYQDFSLNAGATFATAHSDGIGANVQTSGTITYSTDANYTFNGTSAQVTGDLLPSIINDLTVDNAAGVTLNNDLVVNGNLNILNGDLHLDGHLIDLGMTGTLIETAGNTVTDLTGSILAMRDLNAPNGVNLGGLGVMFTSTDNLGFTLVQRVHSPAMGNGNQGILRQFLIDFVVPPKNNGKIISKGDNISLATTLRFYYDESELNGIAEANLTLFQSPTGNNNAWQQMGGVVNTANNYVEISNVVDFLYWTFGNINAPIPVELVSFTSNVSNKSVILNWVTATELNNSGWNIERKQPDQNWEKIGFIEGSGNSTTNKNYSFIDKNVSSGIYQYRLQQIDFDGTSTCTYVIDVEFSQLPSEFYLYQNYPNPFNPSTKIKFDVPVSACVNISVYNTIGEKIETIVNEQLEAGVHFADFDASTLPSGIYIYRLTSNNYVFTNKMILIK